MPVNQVVGVGLSIQVARDGLGNVVLVPDLFYSFVVVNTQTQRIATPAENNTEQRHTLVLVK